MKYWKDKEVIPVEKMNFWKGDYITKLEPNEVFVFGANPQARLFAGAAKAALGFGAVPINVKQNKPGIARGLSPNNKTYALITKSLEAGYTEPETGITYHKEGFQSVSPEQIRANVDELYETAKKPEHLDKKFLVTYQYETWPNGTPKKSLNGYTSQEMLEMFAKDKDVPPNIVFHESYKPHLEKLYKNQKKQSIGELVVYEDGKSIDIKEEDIVWTIDSDERNPEGINGAGAAKAAMSLSNGAKHGVGRGFNGSNAYALVTKSLNAGFLEKSTGILYDKEGYCSVSPEQIRANIDELYEIARSPEHKDKKFLVSYQYESWPNGTPKKSLNGYTSQEMLEMFVHKDIPPNIIFHESYKSHLEKALTKLITIEESSTKQEEKPKEIAFTKVSLPFGWMGNMSHYPIVYEGKEYKNTEALFQSLRFVGFEDIQQEIMNEKSPMSAKLVAKKYKHMLEENGYILMGKKDVENMRLCIKLKLEQYPELKQQLIDTGNIQIIEDCTKRPQGSGVFWGAAYQEGKWVGENVLGHILMEFRHNLQNNQELVVIKKSNAINQLEETDFLHLTSPFSNLHPSKFEYKGITFISNEQFMMYSKARNFKDESSAEKILELNQDPLAKKFLEGELSREDIVKDKVLSDQWNNLMKQIDDLGKEVKNYNEAYWESRKDKIMLFGMCLKFNQNIDLENELMKINELHRVENSNYNELTTMQYIIKKIKEEISTEKKTITKIKP